MVEAVERFFEVSTKASAMKLELTEAEKVEHTRIAQEFTRQSQIRHNKYEKDLTNKIYLQQEALNALPEQLKIAASQIDHEPPPPDRPMAVWATPPIKGFDVRDYVGKNSEEDEFEDDEEDIIDEDDDE